MYVPLYSSCSSFHIKILFLYNLQISPVTTVFGMHVDVVNELHTRSASWAPFYPLCGRFKLHFTCRPTEDRPRLIEFKVS